MDAAVIAVRIAKTGPAARSHWQRWLLLAPSLVFLFACTYWPLIAVLERSLLDQPFGTAASSVSGNDARLFADPHFGRASLNNFLYGIGTIVPSAVFALAFALAPRETNAVTMALRTLLVLPLLVPLVAAAPCSPSCFCPGRACSTGIRPRLALPP